MNTKHVNSEASATRRQKNMEINNVNDQIPCSDPIESGMSVPRFKFIVQSLFRLSEVYGANSPRALTVTK